MAPASSALWTCAGAAQCRVSAVLLQAVPMFCVEHCERVCSVWRPGNITLQTAGSRKTISTSHGGETCTTHLYIKGALPYMRLLCSVDERYPACFKVSEGEGRASILWVCQLWVDGKASVRQRVLAGSKDTRSHWQMARMTCSKATCDCVSLVDSFCSWMDDMHSVQVTHPQCPFNALIWYLHEHVTDRRCHLYL